MTKDNPQRALFDKEAGCTVFEQPLNERMRGFLRLEHLFQGVAACMARDTPLDSRQAVAGLIEIADQLGRADLKGELVKETERQITAISGLRDSPEVNRRTLDQILMRLEPLNALLRAGAALPGARMRQCELVTQIRQRLAIPGGLCSFDLPAFHHWLHRGYRQRLAQLNDWMEDLRLIEDAVNTTLRLIRESTSPEAVTAISGFHQQSLDPTSGCQLVRVILTSDLELFPEISGGKHRFTVRFMQQPDLTQRPQQTSGEVHFGLQCCGL